MRVRLLLVAEQELDEAVAWYNNQADQLGSVFAAEVFDGIALMREYPNAWHRLGPRTRRFRLRRFPYGLVYAVLPDELVIIAVMHLHRQPDYWRNRLPEL